VLIKVLLASTVLLLALARSAFAEPGVTPDTVTLMQIAGFSGQVASAVSEQNAAAVAYFEAINARGGVHGRRVVLRTADDHFEPPQTAKLAGGLIGTENEPFAYFLPRGTPNVEAMLKRTQPAGIPVVAQSGAQIFHHPVNSS